jgi:hypothetical protein
MTKEFDLVGRNASNLRGAIGEIIAWDALRRMGIHAFKIGTWNFFPEGYPYWRGELNNEHRFLTREQAEFVENKVRNNIMEFDFVGIRLKEGREFSITEVENMEDFMAGKEKGIKKFATAKDVESVYLIEVKAGHPRTVRHYAENPTKAFALENIEKAKEIGFKVLLIIVELLDDWKCRTSYREL